jgi:hypothetical protein
VDSRTRKYTFACPASRSHPVFREVVARSRLVLHDRHFCGKLSGIFDRALLAEKDQVIEQPGAVPVESREKLHYDGLLAASSQPPSLRRPENLMKCRGCGVELDPSEEQVHSPVDRILGNSRQDAQKKGGVCPLCGRSQKVPYSHRRTVLLGLLLACLIVMALNMQRSRQTKAAVVPEYSNRLVAAPRFDGEFPCVFASVTDGGVRPQVGNCAMPTVHGTPIDRFEADLRMGISFSGRPTCSWTTALRFLSLVPTARIGGWIKIPCMRLGATAIIPTTLHRLARASRTHIK